MDNYRRLLLLVVMVVSTLGLNAQVFIQNTMYQYNRFVYNPAAAGTGDDARVTLLGRLQWLGIDGAPRLFSAQIETPLEVMDSGLGAYVMADQLGPLTTTGLNVAYSYHFELASGAKFSIGAAGGILQKSLSGNFVYNLDNGIDPLIPSGDFSSNDVVPALSAGIYFTLPDDKAFIGISGQDLLEPSIDALTLTPGLGPDSRVTRSFYLSGGYRFEVASDVSLLTSILARTDGVSYQTDLSLHATLKERIVLGGSYRMISNESVSGIVGAKVTDRLFLGYSYDFVLSGLNANGDLSSHELVLSYILKPISGGGSRKKSGLDDVIKRNY